MHDDRSGAIQTAEFHRLGDKSAAPKPEIRVDSQTSTAVEPGNPFSQASEAGSAYRTCPQSLDSTAPFGLWVGGIQDVIPSARVGVDDPERFVLLAEMLQEQHQDPVFQHVGMVTGVEMVAVAAHRTAGLVRSV